MTTRIRVATELDADQVAAIYAPEVRETAISFEIDPPTTQEMQQRIRETLRQWPWLVCERDGQILGYAYAGRHRARAAYRWSADASVYVDRGARRSGVGRALYAPLLKILALQRFHNAYAGITLPNPSSVGLHESLGFRPIGVYAAVGYKLGAWHDVGWWHLLLRERSSPLAPPTDFAELRDKRECEDALRSAQQLLRA